MRVTIDQTSLSQPEQKGQPGGLAIQEQAERKAFEKDFIIQVIKRAQEEWESFCTDDFAALVEHVHFVRYCQDTSGWG